MEKGIPGDPRFPERDNEWVEEQTKKKTLLIEWLENFKSKFAEYKEARSIIEDCENVLGNYKDKVEKVRIPIEIQNARNARKPKSNLEYGLDYHLRGLTSAVSSPFFVEAFPPSSI